RRPQAQQLHRRTAARAERGHARHAVGARDAASIRVLPAMAGRRPHDLGQPLHVAPARSLRPERAPCDAPHADQGRPPVSMKAETNAGFAIERIEVDGVAVPLVGGGFMNAYVTMTVQKRAIVRVFAVDGAVGLGNIDPSPGYST